MTTPAQVTIHSSQGLDRQQYVIRLSYQVENPASRDALVKFELDGEIDGQPFQDGFDLPGDIAFNFASSATRVLRRHGLRVCQGPVLRFRKEHDRVFDDLRRKLGAEPGKPVDLQRMSSLAPAQPRCAVAESIVRQRG
ncbi:DUF5064 family protein [Pseudomonas sp. ZM23]|uniref:DUF5064 family protein n=1 Tax=Pseudomonas triclosanedens TaxID=2961893 RepID=A0ABY7A3B2_9PSED|nr:DUF5064 family protein [Pseudomonas triclosanedens]MCP8464920.1 DUF5064 family protein [Pseudomonas triclosanedens]MCP8470368.1 DUF5064 family protein [Pseudomonas triclosanedens]MCP8476173.1 DUF5064 family protein [Pseudomonas triclosanedens]WAI51593.1 DUF5064 family protein [Pseudomonas triclosanedens]